MMTKQEHINYWIEAANKDWVVVFQLFDAKSYIHALFWAHIVLEKLCKANWVKDNTSNTPPKVHNLISIIAKTKVILEENDLDFLITMNQFQLEGRYPDYKFELFKRYKEEQTKEIIDRVNTIRECLLKSL